MKFIASSREVAKLYMRKEIGTGQGTSLWFDPWMATGSIVDQVGITNCIIRENPYWRLAY